MTGSVSAASGTRMHRLRRQLGAIPLLGPGLRSLFKTGSPFPSFRSSPSYWEERYRQGGNSGVGSYGQLARFKAQTINRFVAEQKIGSVVEFGCGDGAQLALAEYPHYTGFDVSPRVVSLCRRKFAGDPNKQFHDLSGIECDTVKADMAMSLDVIYHLVEDSIYDLYMERLAKAGERFLCIYSSNASLPGHVPHIRHRCFTDWIEANAPEWTLIQKVRNAHPHDPANPDETSWADFYFFTRSGNAPG